MEIPILCLELLIGWPRKKARPCPSQGHHRQIVYILHSTSDICGYYTITRNEVYVIGSYLEKWEWQVGPSRRYFTPP